MIAGLPGTGISGLFYLLSALWMPIAELIRALRRRKRQSNWKFVFLQFTLSGGIFAAFGVTFALIDYFLPISVKFLKAFTPNSTNNLQTESLGAAPTFITLAVLFIFLFAIEIIGMILGHRKSRNLKIKLNTKKETIIVNGIFINSEKAIENTN